MKKNVYLVVLSFNAKVYAKIHGIASLGTSLKPRPDVSRSRSDLPSYKLNISGGASDRPKPEDTSCTDKSTNLENESVLVDEDAQDKEIRGGATKVLQTIEMEGGELKDALHVPSTPAICTMPVRISTNVDGHSVMTGFDTSRVLTRKEKRIERRIRRTEERSHKKYAKKLKNRNNLNIGRKVMHAGFGFFFATLNQIIPREIFIPGMSILTSGTLAMELLRYRKGFGWMNDVLHFVLGSSLRKHEMEGKFTGSFYYFLGVTITAAMYPGSVATLGICQLALADPSASYFGSQTKHVYWSRIENGFFGVGRNKGILGFLGGACFCFPFNYLVLSKSNFFGKASIEGISKIIPVAVPGRKTIAIASIALGLAGAFADLCVPSPALTMPKKIYGVSMPPFHVDDNIVVPIFSAYACNKIFEVLGWSAGVNLARHIIF